MRRSGTLCPCSNPPLDDIYENMCFLEGNENIAAHVQDPAH